MSADLRLDHRRDRSWRSVAMQMAAISAIAVAVVYLTQPLLSLIASEFRLSPSHAGLVVASAQLGYALGVVFLIPLIDTVRPRRQLGLQLLVAGGALIAAGLMPFFWALCICVFLTGFVANVAQIIVSLINRFAPEGMSGRTTALLGSAAMIGIFGGRVTASFVGDLAGWRWTFVVFGIAIALSSLWIGRLVGQRVRALNSHSYRKLLGDLPRTFLRSATLRWSAARQGLVNFSFSAIWTVVAIHLTSALGWSPAAAGLVGLAGLVGAPAVRIMGGWMDGPRSAQVLPIATSAVVIGCALLCFSDSVPCIVIGLAALSAGAQLAQAVQQMTLFRADPATAGRSITVYLFFVFLGGVAGAVVGASSFEAGGLRLSAIFAAAVAGLSLATVAWGAIRSRRASPRTLA